MKKIVCPNCGCEEIWKAGKDQKTGKQRYRCKNCRREFTTGRYKKYKNKVFCPDCGSGDIKIKERKNGLRFECNSCGATFKNKSKVKLRPSQKREWIKHIKKLHKEGWSIRKIKAEIKAGIPDYSERSILQLIHEALGDRKKKITKEDVEKFLQYRKIGYSPKRAAELVGFSYKALMANVKKLNLKVQ